jgi:hypothetical protein
MTHPTIDLIFLAHGRPEFTSVSLLNLIKNTNWAMVEHFWIYTDGETEALYYPDTSPKFPLNLYFIKECFGGPVAILNHALSISSADYIAKIDNDTIVPPRWLEQSCTVLNDFRVDLLGIEAWAPDPTVFPPTLNPADTWGNASRCVRIVPNIGGIGLFRRRAFESRPLPTPNGASGRFGLSEWQWNNPQAIKAFIDPPLPVFLLDHLPFEPWRTLNAQYDASGVQRRVWREYPEHCRDLWQWWEGSPENIATKRGRAV